MPTLSPQTNDFLVSVHPNYATKILEGEKTVELRRRFPLEGNVGATMLLYSTSPVRAVVGHAKIKRVEKLSIAEIWSRHADAACIARKEFMRYFSDVKFGFAITLRAAKPIPSQITAEQLALQFGIVPPQSYRYVAKSFLSSISNEQLQTSGRYEHSNCAGRPPAGSGGAR